MTIRVVLSSAVQTSVLPWWRTSARYLAPTSTRVIALAKAAAQGFASPLPPTAPSIGSGTQLILDGAAG